MTADRRQQYRAAALAAQRAVLAGGLAADDVVATQPNAVLDLLDYLDEIEREAIAVIEDQQAEIERMRSTHALGALLKTRDSLDVLIEAKRKALALR